MLFEQWLHGGRIYGSQCVHKEAGVCGMSAARQHHLSYMHAGGNRGVCM